MATFTNFCCRSGGSNLNAGTRIGDTTVPGTSANLTYASGTWVNATGVFTVASGNPLTDGVAVADMASVYPDAATVTPFVGRVTARDATTITVSLTAKMGTAPVDGTSNTTLKIGGAWLGPNGASGFPFDTMQNTLTNVAGNFPRINFMNDATYSVTAAVSQANAGPTVYAGFTTTYGDLGKATLDGGAAGASYALFTINGVHNRVEDFIFQRNGATGNLDGCTVAAGGAEVQLSRCVVNNVRGRGFNLGGAQGVFVELEAYACCLNNTAGVHAIKVNVSTAKVIRLIAHDNAGSNVDGFDLGGSGQISNCISETNGRYGLSMDSTNVSLSLLNCDFYNNTNDGVNVSGSAGNKVSLYIENCNFIKNGGWGINATAPTGAGFLQGQVINCGFGSGTQVNTSGTVNLTANVTETGSITYASGTTPWNAPTTGDFRINLAAAINAGRGTFTQTQASYTGTIGYPDIGAAQHLEAAASTATGGGGVMIIRRRPRSR